MKASIDIKITYDDLSEQCKQKIKKLEKELDCTVNLVYPDITSIPNISFGKTHDWSTTTSPYKMHDWKDNINDLVLRSPQCSELDDLVLRSPQPRDKDGNPHVVLCCGKSASSSGKSSSSSGKTCYYDCN